MITKEEFKEYCRNNNLRYKVDNKYWRENNLKSNWNSYDLFIILCCHGYIETIKWFLTLEKINIHCNDEEAFEISCLNGYLEIAKLLMEIAKENGEIINIHVNEEEAFRGSCSNGHIEVAKWLIEISKENGDKINIHENNEYAFRISCNYEHIEIAKWLCSLCDEYYIEIENDKIVKYGIKNIYDKFLEENKGIKKMIKKLQMKII